MLVSYQIDSRKECLNDKKTGHFGCSPPQLRDFEEGCNIALITVIAQEIAMLEEPINIDPNQKNLQTGLETMQRSQ